MLKKLRKRIRKNKNINKIKLIGKNVKLIDDIRAMVFHLDKQGPDLTYQLPNKLFPFSEADFIKFSTFYYLAIGQGNNRNYGLFELPVPGYPEYHSMIYAFDVIDPDNEDPRAEGKNYCLLVILHPRWLRKFLHHSWKMEMIIQDYLLPYYKLENFRNSEIVDKLLTKIVPEIPSVYDVFEEDVSHLTEIKAIN
ncbi:MAG: hypothetical protein HeimC3_01960 [Candidatus Heimdallarchaeota archaeon LC_3]|nr:MAG: hypothetical protein HeimC3_01960 [Candidatus Heimdallarchaeota archaeon LC_3]